MEHFLNIKENNIHFYFEEPLIENIKDLYFKYDPNVELINKCYVHYYDEKRCNDKRYIFRGLYKDGYFIILIDSIDLKWNNIVYCKDVVLTKLDWCFTKINDDLTVHKLNVKNNNKYQYIILPIRNYLNNNTYIFIEDLIYSNIKKVNNLIINKKKDLKHFLNLKSLFIF